MKKVLMDLSKYLGVKGLRGVAHYYGVPESRIYSWTKKGRIANPGLILSRNPELSQEWVATGKGPMLTADKATGQRRRRMPQQADKAANLEIAEAAATTERDQEAVLELGPSSLLSQVMAIIDAGGATKAILEAQVKALTQALEKEREQKALLAELAQIRASLDGVSSMLQAMLPTAPESAAGDENAEEAGEEEPS
jgi:DNA-binding FrmR family transcriptional regulator